MIASFAGEDDHGCDVGSEGDANVQRNIFELDGALIALKIDDDLCSKYRLAGGATVSHSRTRRRLS